MNILNLFKKKKTETVENVREFKATKYSNTHLRPVYVQINKDIYRSVDSLRSHARELEKNSEYVSRYLSVITNNVVGDGFKFVSKVKNFDGSFDEIVNKLLKERFENWSYNCEVSGMDFKELQKLAMSVLARDGEVLIINTYDNGEYKLSFLDSERIDTRQNSAFDNFTKTQKINGIKVNEFGKPISYYIKTSLEYGADSIEISADQVIHVFKKANPEQTRGYSFLAPAIVQLSHLSAFQESAIIAARVGASKMGFFTLDSSNSTAPLVDDENSDIGITSVAPGQFGVLPDGYGFQSFDPSYPDSIYKDFIKTTLRSVAAALNVSYNSLANDLESVNFSSIRAGVLEEREHYKSLQRLLERNLLNKIYENWLLNELKNGKIVINNKVLGVDKFEKFCNYSFVGRVWDYVNPKQEIEAAVVAITSGITSISDVLEKKGEDFDDVIAKIKRERLMLAEAGIELKDITIVNNIINGNNAEE